MAQQGDAKISAKGLEKIFVSKNGGARKRNGRNGDGSAPREYTAMRGLDLDVRAGELLVVVGPSGCGKTTLLNFLGGLDQPTSGDLLLDDQPIGGPGLDRGIVFQDYALFPWRTALANVEFGLEAKGTPKKERAEIAERYLTLVGLSAFADRYPHELSGGMKQRVAIARALAYDPDVLLLDEPFAAVDAQTREILQCELRNIWEKTGKTIVFVTHSIDEAVFLGQRVAVMTARPGRIKQVIEVDLPRSRVVDEDVRSSSAFTAVRHRLWSLLKEEVAKSEADMLGHSEELLAAFADESAAPGGSHESRAASYSI